MVASLRNPFLEQRDFSGTKKRYALLLDASRDVVLMEDVCRPRVAAATESSPVMEALAEALVPFYVNSCSTVSDRSLAASRCGSYSLSRLITVNCSYDYN